MHARLVALLVAVSLIVLPPLAAAPAPPPKAGKADGDGKAGKAFDGLKLRNIGPALMSGRIADIAIDPTTPSTWYVAVGSGGVWKTVNAGHHLDARSSTRRASYSIGCVTIDPSEPPRGLGRHGGERRRPSRRLWRRRLPQPRRRRPLGEPRAQGLPAHHEDRRSPRRLRRRLGGGAGPAVVEGRRAGRLQDDATAGKTWAKVLGGGEWTGVTDVVIDPRDPDRALRRHLAAPPHGGRLDGRWPGDRDPPLDRRRRDLGGAHEGAARGHTWPRSAWRSRPQNPDVLYAAIELNRRTGGRLPFDRSRLLLGEALRRGGRAPPGPTTTRSSTPAPTPSTGSTSWTSGCRSRTTGARRSGA